MFPKNLLRHFLQLIADTLRDMESHPVAAGKDFPRKFVQSLDDQIDEIQKDPAKFGLSPDDFVDLRHMIEAIVRRYNDRS